MSWIKAVFRFLANLGLWVTAAPILLIWWVVYLFVATGIAVIVLGLFREHVLHLPVFNSPTGFLDWIANIVIYGASWAAATKLWAQRSGVDLLFRRDPGDSHGSARFANRKELASLEAGNGLLIGRNPATGKLLRYDGAAHLLTLAPTRAGKGVGTVIPNLLMVERSMLVIDPKGENARIAGEARRRFGDVHILDPFGVSDTGRVGDPGKVTGQPSSAYNPLDRLAPDSLDLSEDAASLADALVMDPPGQVSEAHWNEEAKALLSGLIIFCVCHEDKDRRTLATVREYLTLPPEKLRALLNLMQDSDAAGGLIARAANRFLGKADREAASVMSNAQRHTHFLDSPRIAKVTSRSDFHFSDLRHRITSVFLVLPPNRMDAYSRWLRLLVSQALQDIARAAEVPKAPLAAVALSEAPVAAAPARSAALTATSEPLAGTTAGIDAPEGARHGHYGPTAA